MTPDPGTLDRVRALTEHPAFSMTNPNRVRSLIGAFAQGNPTQFNRADGAGYEFVADRILALDPNNPQVASRMTTAFKSWRVLEAAGAPAREAALQRIASAPSCRATSATSCSARLLNPRLQRSWHATARRVQRVETTPQFGNRRQNAARRISVER